MEFFALFVGLAGLWIGTQATIRGAIAVALRLGVSEFVVGIVILSIGSDLPELSIAIDAAIKNLHGGKASDVVVGSALGSSMGQIGLVLGVTALFGYLAFPKKTIYQQGAVLLGSLLLLALVGLDGYVSRTEGISLIVFYAIYLLFMLAGAVSINKSGGGWWTTRLLNAFLILVVGLVVVVGSAELTVSSAIQVAATLGIEQSVIAVIIIGLGTSLPELSISLGAILKRRAGLSLGNLIGSNVFDTLMPVGVAASIARLEFDAELLRFELPFLFLLTSVVLIFLVRRLGLQKHEAIVIIAMYCTYVAVKVQEVIL